MPLDGCSRSLLVGRDAAVVAGFQDICETSIGELGRAFAAAVAALLAAAKGFPKERHAGHVHRKQETREFLEEEYFEETKKIQDRQSETACIYFTSTEGHTNPFGRYAIERKGKVIKGSTNRMPWEWLLEQNATATKMASTGGPSLCRGLGKVLSAGGHWNTGEWNIGRGKTNGDGPDRYYTRTTSNSAAKMRHAAMIPKAPFSSLPSIFGPQSLVSAIPRLEGVLPFHVPRTTGCLGLQVAKYKS